MTVYYITFTYNNQQSWSNSRLSYDPWDPLNLSFNFQELTKSVAVEWVYKLWSEQSSSLVQDNQHNTLRIWSFIVHRIAVGTWIMSEPHYVIDKNEKFNINMSIKSRRLCAFEL